MGSLEERGMLRLTDSRVRALGRCLAACGRRSGGGGVGPGERGVTEVRRASRWRRLVNERKSIESVAVLELGTSEESCFIRSQGG